MNKFSSLQKILPGKKYTLVGISGTGVPYYIHITFKTFKIDSKNKDLATIVYKKKSGTTLVAKKISSKNKMIIFRGWNEPNSDIFVKNKYSVPQINHSYLEKSCQTPLEGPVAYVGA